MGVMKNGRRDRRSGMAMVEMVIVAPVLCMLIFAIAEFGVMFRQYQLVSNAAREGARLSVVFRNPCDGATVQNEVVTAVQTYFQNSTGGLNLPAGQISVAGQCGGPDTNSTVQVTWPHTFNIVPNFAPSVNPTISLVGSSVMRNEG
jgi:Flp pilus assembly protein TadG